MSKLVVLAGIIIFTGLFWGEPDVVDKMVAQLVAIKND